VITLADAIAMAQRTSPRLRQAQAITERSLAAERTARAYANPSVEIYEGRQYARDIATPGVPGLLQHYGGSQAIEIPAERAARRRVAEAATRSSRLLGSLVGPSVVGNTERAFYDALRRREAVALAEENLKLVEDLRRRVEVEVEVGEKGRLELTRTEAELARAQFLLRSAQLEYATGIARLRLAIAAAPDAELDPRGELPPRVGLGPLEQMRREVLASHPGVRQSEADIRQAQAILAHERASRIPRPALFAEFENQPDIRYWRAGVNLPLPLFDRRRGQIGEARAEIARSSALLEERRLEITAALERAYEQYQLADQQVISLESGPVRAAQGAVEGARAAYRFGERGIVEVLDAQRVLEAVRGDLLEARFARQAARIDLEELGALAPEGQP
jgi:cobalt-zinc-cadmium efflux system outer membrane protein